MTTKPLRLEFKLRNNRIIRERELLGYESAAAFSRGLDLRYEDVVRYESLKLSPLTILRRADGLCARPGCAVAASSSRALWCPDHKPHTDDDLREIDELLCTRAADMPVTWRSSALSLADALGVDPEWLWPAETLAIKKTRAVAEVGAADIQTLMATTGRALLAAPDSVVGDRELKEHIEAAMETLTPREAKVLRLRFGIGEESDHTLEETAAQVPAMTRDGMSTKERVRQIEAKALRKLRHPSRSLSLKPFIA